LQRKWPTTSRYVHNVLKFAKKMWRGGCLIERSTIAAPFASPPPEAALVVQGDGRSLIAQTLTHVVSPGPYTAFTVQSDAEATSTCGNLRNLRNALDSNWGAKDDSLVNAVEVGDTEVVPTSVPPLPHVAAGIHCQYVGVVATHLADWRGDLNHSRRHPSVSPIATE
jgi:hypothetical protein